MNAPRHIRAADWIRGAFFRAFLALLAGLLVTACDNAPAPLPGAPTGGDFVLDSAAGPIDSKTLRGKVLLIYFGYVNCVDVCPPSLAFAATAINALTPQERARTQLLMITVDPQRDTPAALKRYVAFFHPAALGLSGTPEQIAAVAKAYGVGYQRQATLPDGGYIVDHSSFTYVVAPDGRLVAALPLGTPPEQLTTAIRKLL